MTSRIFAPEVLAGQVCVVTGAGTGLGRAAALELARCGATVVVCGRRPEPIIDTAAAIAALGATAAAYPLDIRDEYAVDDFFDTVVERHGRVDTLVNNAGGQFMCPAERITPKGFRTVLDLNIMGTWLMTHAAATKAMIPQTRGKILNVTLSPHHGFPGLAHSAAARAAVENLTRTLSVEWARFGIRLCAVATGHMNTSALRGKYPPGVTEAALTTIPLGRYGTESEFAWLITYLASPAGDYLSGTVLTLDGARDNLAHPWPPPGFTEIADMVEKRGPRTY
ncbi:SDR family oxidoreductase [Nocardia sp. NPDC004123]